jgi:hypothetical protein
MVIPFGAPEVAHLVRHRLEPVVHSLRLFSFLRMNRPSSPPIVSRLVILVTSSPSCAVLRMSQISLAEAFFPSSSVLAGESLLSP